MYTICSLQSSWHYTVHPPVIHIVLLHNFQHFGCVPLFILDWQPLFPSYWHTQGIVYYPVSLMHMAHYSLMTSLTQGRSRPCRAGDESLLSVKPSTKQQTCSGKPNLSLHLSHQMWFNMDTDDWLKTAMLLNVKVADPDLVVSSRLMTQVVRERLAVELMSGALSVFFHKLT